MNTPREPRAREWDESYRDTGCEFSPRCLECPLPACRYDMPPKRAGMYLRALQVLPLVGRGRTIAQLADDIGVSRRTMFRLLPYVRALHVATHRERAGQAGQAGQEIQPGAHWP
jgi:hypothetical protein